ncbi:hypothetical protein SAMN05518672_1011606 [Chitinophaga sp. CF118]|uniref:hypothetical protein n=1 Tax=Chitinophaga sp. CF118 TaxID=1884367 RepID=UPI0008E9DDFF|nr:hypothetical protein [Chitinophaga sp. CF118]SFD31957.1 hypothetical protein SAMN05518672_1011606 [Chitinophaga sp. CF118]
MTRVNLANDKGQRAAVLIPRKKWNDLQKDLKVLGLLSDLKKSFQEMELHSKGKLKSPTAKQLLSQL